MYYSSRGLELPGNYNHVLLSELFHEQSSRWRNIAVEHLASVHCEITNFVEAALRYIVKDELVLTELMDNTQAALQKNLVEARRELGNLCEDENRQPITYNHYYTDNVQNARQESTRKAIQQAVKSASAEDWNGKLHISNTSVDSEKLLASLQKRVIVDMDEQACAEALAGLSAYYKVRIRLLLHQYCCLIFSGGNENVCRQCVPAGHRAPHLGKPACHILSYERGRLYR